MMDKVERAAVLDSDVLDHSSNRGPKPDEYQEEDSNNAEFLGRRCVELHDTGNRQGQDPDVKQEIGNGETVEERERYGAVL